MSLHLSKFEHSRIAGLEITPKGDLYHNLSVCDYYELALKHEQDTRVVSSGALAARSYEKTGGIVTPNQSSFLSVHLRGS